MSLTRLPRVQALSFNPHNPASKSSKFHIILPLLLILGSMKVVVTLPRTGDPSDDLLAGFRPENNNPSLESFQAQLMTGKSAEMVGV